MKFFFPLFLICIIQYSCKEKLKSKSNSDEKAVPQAEAPTISVVDAKISDINFPNQQYSIDFEMEIDYSDTCTRFRGIDLVHNMNIMEAKGDVKISNVDTTQYDDSSCEYNL